MDITVDYVGEGTVSGDAGELCGFEAKYDAEDKVWDVYVSAPGVYLVSGVGVSWPQVVNKLAKEILQTVGYRL